MRVQHQVVPGIKPQRHSRRLRLEDRPRLPEEKMPVRIKCFRLDLQLHPGKSAARKLLLTSRRMRPINQQIRVMHQALCSRVYFDGLHPARFSKGRLEYEIPILVAAARRKRVRFFSTQDQVGLSELPSRGKL